MGSAEQQANLARVTLALKMAERKGSRFTSASAIFAAATAAAQGARVSTTREEVAGKSSAKPAASSSTERSSRSKAPKQRVPAPSPPAAAAAAAVAVQSSRPATRLSTPETQDAAAEHEPYAAASASGGVLKKKSKKKKKKKSVARTAAGAAAPPPASAPAAAAPAAAAAADNVKMEKKPLLRTKAVEDEVAGAAAAAAALPPRTPIVVPAAPSPMPAQQQPAPTRAEYLAVAAAKAKAKARELQQATAKAQREAENALRAMSEEFKRMEEGPGRGDDAAVAAAAAGGSGTSFLEGEEGVDPRLQRGADGSPRARYDVSSSEGEDGDGAGPQPEVTGQVPLQLGAQQPLQPAPLLQQQGQQPWQGEGSPRARYDVSSSDENGDGSDAGYVGGQAPVYSGASPMDEDEEEEEEDGSSSTPARYDVSSSDDTGSGAGVFEATVTDKSRAGGGVSSARDWADEEAPRGESPVIGRYDVSSSEEEEEEDDSGIGGGGGGEGIGGFDGSRDACPTPSPTGSLPLGRYDVSSSGDDEPFSSTVAAGDSGRSGRAARRAAEIMEAVALAAEYRNNHAAAAAGSAAEDGDDEEEEYSPWDMDSEGGEESGDEVYAFAGRRQRRRLLPRSSARKVSHSGAEFEWGEVDLQDPLAEHKGLLDRLAGMGTPLPGMPAPSSGSVVGSARGSVVGSARGSRSGSVASASDAADGVPYANSRHPATTQSSSESSASPNPNNMKRVKKKSKNGHASRGVYAPPPAAAAGPPRRPVAVSNVDRAAGVGHWTNLMHSAGNVDPIELNPAKRAAAGAVAAAPGKKGGEGARSVPPPPAPVVEPPKPMKEFPPGSGKMVLDELAHARMYPGGAVLNMKSFKLKQKSAVSAAFEMCAAMEPKSRPSFENKNKDAAKNISPFTLNVSVNGVAYSPATAKNTKLAKQLASINFLREAVGTREQLDLESLIAETTGGSLAGSAAIAAAISQGKPATGAGAGGGAKGGAKGSRGGGGASDGGGGSGKGTEGSATGTDNDDDPVAKHALGDGLQNYAQLLHDLVAAHPETPNYASYMFRALKDNASQQKSKLTGKGFRCFARLLRHVVDPVETAKRKEVEAAKSAIEVAAKASLGEDPENEALKEAAREAHKDFLKHRAIPKLSIGVLSAEGDGANKRDAKHKAAQGLMYALMPKCKTDEDLRSQAKVVIEKYQAEKKVRMEKEQKAAQEAKRAREAAKKAKKAGAAAGRATAAASRVPAADPSAAIPHPETRGDRAMLNALTAAVKSAEDRRASEASLAEGGDAAGEEGSGASEAVPMAVAEDDGADDASAPADAAGVPADETGVTADANGGSANANGVPADANGVPADANGAEETPAVVVPAPAPASAAIVRSASTASAPVAGGRPGTRATRATAAAGVAAVTAAPAETAADGGEADA
ncbi:hypothetical protein Esi_0051_0073 [Ectocarpus siliculosus]|uniref:DRBM domain-containing protein n=1 Tax=Ectocarpus siliculosus TaxID=2880 RepID=D7G3I5_ECTSI|nr:hypothetical protein Esi_0051_0073 [Ectocarpus siliculosus]|eukprot:CBJ26983.1 hypothetical protein Esi_0051_0073 [Ectocarpus siliculosus]